MTETTQPKLNAYEISAWIISAAALLLVFRLHLLSALLSGLLVYELVHITAPLLRLSRLSHNRAKLIVVGLLAALIVTLFVLLIWGMALFFRSETNSISALFKKMAEIIEGARDRLPDWLAVYLPEGAEKLREGIVHWLRGHARGLQEAGKEAGMVMVHILIGMILGAIISFREAVPTQEYRPLAGALARRARLLSDAFRAIVFAQVRISALNTIFAWLYLGVALPLFGVHLPLVKTMVAITFLAGLLPVIGNLISNAIIVVISLSYSLSVSGASFLFLVVVHKLEYFLNAHIVGSRIHARTWELLLAILIMDAAFGMAGVIAAPVYYAYIKSELTEKGFV
ncbi:MAG: AI-2E family transporter [Deltaproteobacteria bacterium]|nr:AI-2E family transporter [Deltaproteobacteria bacterium]MBF0524935.1 AI-2E family transporter [Deltaproteobacteria bacterium]